MKKVLGLIAAGFLSTSAFADACNSQATLQRITGIFGAWGYTVVDFGPHEAIGFPSSPTCTFPNMILNSSLGSHNYKMSFRIEPGTGIQDFDFKLLN